MLWTWVLTQRRLISLFQLSLTMELLLDEGIHGPVCLLNLLIHLNCLAQVAMLIWVLAQCTLSHEHLCIYCNTCWSIDHKLLWGAILGKWSLYSFILPRSCGMLWWLPLVIARETAFVDFFSSFAMVAQSAACLLGGVLILFHSMVGAVWGSAFLWLLLRHFILIQFGGLCSTYKRSSDCLGILWAHSWLICIMTLLGTGSQLLELKGVNLRDLLSIFRAPVYWCQRKAPFICSTRLY